MVYLTGDTHNEFTRLSNKYFKKYDLEIGENDYIIVCGDLGLCWSKDKTFEWNCKWFAEKPYTLLWVQGNHENYDMIDEYPIEKWHGGNVRHIVRDKVILLERGQIFDIEGKSFLHLVEHPLTIHRAEYLIGHLVNLNLWFKGQDHCIYRIG